jgi:uncharacterized membrane protein
LDFVALAVFVASWVGYTLAADHGPWHKRSVSAVMSRYRTRWMRQMLLRENRMIDTNINASLQNGAAFFASTTIFALGGLIAILGASEQAMAFLEKLPVVHQASPSVWQLKVLMMVAILAYAFFKFAWSFRLYNYSAVLLGAAPVEAHDDPEADGIARRAARISTLAGRHFNRGLRGYFFALAALGWFIHPGLFIATCMLVVLVIYRREFRSKSLSVLREGS